eukprot:SAG31_NODE_151_length_22216_cov_37.572139_5_plen_348_part_00
MALKAYEAAIADHSAVCGEWQVATARALLRLWKPPRRWGSLRNCPTFAECPTFKLLGRREDVNGAGRFSSHGGWLPLREIDYPSPHSNFELQMEADGSTSSSIWLRQQSETRRGQNDLLRSCGRVEEFVRRHYLAIGWDGAYHCENRLFLTLYGLLFWEAIHWHSSENLEAKNDFNIATHISTSETRVHLEARTRASSMVQGFTSKFQDAPHDLCSLQFEPRRRGIINRLLKEIESGDTAGILRRVWRANYGTQSKYVQWDWRDAELCQCSCESVGVDRSRDGAADSVKDVGCNIEFERERTDAAAVEDSRSEHPALIELIRLCDALGPTAVAGFCRLFSQCVCSPL